MQAGALEKSAHSFEVVDAKLWHCGRILRRMRRAHLENLALDQNKLHRVLRRAFNLSCPCRAWLIDGRLAALGGVAGGLLSDIPIAWLTLSEEATRHPRAIVAEARRQLDEITANRAELFATVLPGDAAARRLLTYLGFHIAHEDGTRTRRQIDASLDQPGTHRIATDDGKPLYLMGRH